MLATYCASKYAVHGLIQAAAKEWGAHGIRVNAYAPGPTATDMWANIDTTITFERGLEKGEFNVDRAKNVILGRLGVPDDVAKLVSFLASSDSEYITGEHSLYD